MEQKDKREFYNSRIFEMRQSDAPNRLRRTSLESHSEEKSLSFRIHVEVKLDVHLLFRRFLLLSFLSSCELNADSTVRKHPVDLLVIS